MELLFYKLCFKLLKTFKLLHKTVDSRDCGASEQKEGKYRRKKERKKVTTSRSQHKELVSSKIDFGRVGHILK